MIGAKPTRTQRRTGEMRHTIIEIASQILAESGTAALSVEDVARRAAAALVLRAGLAGKQTQP